MHLIASHQLHKQAEVRPHASGPISRPSSTKFDHGSQIDIESLNFHHLHIISTR